jgi:hypothetical protein
MVHRGPEEESQSWNFSQNWYFHFFGSSIDLNLIPVLDWWSNE